ncbi:MAG: hypothetical protein U1F11_15075 [Steroidobacteraceae bacterium]
MVHAARRRRLRRDLVRLADVDDRVAGFAGRIERGELQFERRRRAAVGCVCARLAARLRLLQGRGRARAAAGRTLAAAPCAHARDRELGEVHDQQLVAELARQVEQQLQGLERLQAAEHAGHGAEHAGLGAVADQPVARRLRPQAAQAGARALWAHRLQLALVLVDAREQQRLAERLGEVVEQELGREVVAAVDDQVGVREQRRAIAGIEPLHRGRAAHVRIERRDARRGQLRLGRPQSASAYQVWRCRFDGSSRSPSTISRRPTPAPARYCSTGTPRPPAPITATQLARRRAWPRTPTSRSAICRE